MMDGKIGTWARKTWQSKEAEEKLTLQGTHHEGEKTLILCLPQYDCHPLMTMNAPAKEDDHEK